jgi:multicomponent Na+:H+ antiporter subunit G
MSGAGQLVTVIGVAGGLVFMLAGSLGLLRFPDPLSRLHALTKADNLGLGLIVAGILPMADGPLAAAKLVAIWLLVLVGGAIAAQLIARVALDRNSGA